MILVSGLLLLLFGVHLTAVVDARPSWRNELTATLRRLRRATPSGNLYDPPTPVFPAKENAPFWMPAPYPFPASTPAPLPTPRKKLANYDPNNPYLDIMTDPYYPNYGLGFAYQFPTLVGGGINWPTGNVLQPSDHFNGTIAYANPVQVRLGTQLGPAYPWQSPRFVKTAKDLSDANALNQFTQLQSLARTNAEFASASQLPVPPALPTVRQTRFYTNPSLQAQQPVFNPFGSTLFR